ncbi:acetyltransferase [Deinococcus phoenicis]|uniref:Acetyltransferase n=1 Tax=Deinococcus phoenicis TaxID=1476583 RepID=A0A016QNN8_9DEIO|nr:GNAT family N-acetyltransferase [Deinococcus phoenicis]EYB67770.1 acetyltransferase [Deinococcus phoenicis]
MTAPQLRPYHPEDQAAVYRICLETGDSGQDASRLYGDPALLGHVYAGPYITHQPDLAFVLEDDRDVAGYILGVLDTAAFEQLLDRTWWPDLRRRYPVPAALPGERTPDERLHALIHTPRTTPAEITARFPSHLHIDLLPRVQGGGQGRRLMTTLLQALRERGSTGVHLGVGGRNTRAIAFYRHLGFQTLQETPTSLILGLDLTT